MKTISDIQQKKLDLVRKYDFKNKVNEFIKEYSYLLKPFLILIVIYGLAFYPIIRANFNYIDDLGRVNYGYRRMG